jgi:hypothetical protein
MTLPNDHVKDVQTAAISDVVRTVLGSRHAHVVERALIADEWPATLPTPLESAGHHGDHGKHGRFTIV